MDVVSSGAPPDTAEVTVVVPARDEEAFIGRCLDSILAQDEPLLQVIVVDGASRDRTPDIVREYAARDPRLELLHNPEAIIPVSLNLALGAARGRWLVRVDAHATVPPGYVRRAVEHLRTGRWGGVGGRKDGVGTTPAGRAIAAAMGSRFGVGNSTYHYGTSTQVVEHVPFGAYPTALLRDLGGWDERLPVAQDFELDYRLRLRGHQLLFDPALPIAWHCRQSIPDLFRQYRRYGRGKAAVARLHPRSLRARHLLPPALVVSLGAAAFSLATGAGDRRRFRLAGAVLAPYLAAVAAATAATARKVPEGAARRYLPAAFVAMHVGWGIGFWEGVAEAVAGGPRPREVRPAGASAQEGRGA